MKAYLRPSLGVLSLLAAFVAGPALGQQEEPAPPPNSPMAAPLSKAYKLLAQGKFQEARNELEQAQQLAGGPCGECLLGLAQVYAADKQWKRALETTREALPLLSSPDHRALAYNQLATAVVQARGSGGQAEAEEALRQAVELGGTWGNLARYNLAEVLFKAERWADAAEAARAYLNAATTEGSVSNKARIVLCHARLHLTVQGVEGKEGDEPNIPSTETSEVTRPEVIYQAPLVYDEVARRLKAPGSVVVEAIIDEEGCATNVRMLRGPPLGYSTSAVEAVRRWVFKPATLQGRPVKVYYVLTTNFV